MEKFSWSDGDCLCSFTVWKESYKMLRFARFVVPKQISAVAATQGHNAAARMSTVPQPTPNPEIPYTGVSALWKKTQFAHGYETRSRTRVYLLFSRGFLSLSLSWISANICIILQTLRTWSRLIMPAVAKILRKPELLIFHAGIALQLSVQIFRLF